MRGFRSFIVEAKYPLSPVIKHETPVEPLLDTAIRHAKHAEYRTRIFQRPFTSQFPDHEMPYQSITHGGVTIAKGYAKQVDDLPTFASTSKNISPRNKKFTVLSHHKVFGEGQAGDDNVPVEHHLTTVMAPSGKHYIFSSNGPTSTYGHWHTPTGEQITSMDVHNHFRIHEPTMFPAKKVNEHYYVIKANPEGNHTVSIANTEPFTATKHPDWKHVHPATRNALDEMMSAVNKFADNYKQAPYKVTNFYEGSGAKNAIQISNGKHDAIILHQKRTGGSTKTLYNKFGQSGVTHNHVGNHATVFGSTQ